MRVSRKKRITFPPIPTEEFTKSQIKQMVRDGWRIFIQGDIEFIVPTRDAPMSTIGGRIAAGSDVARMPRLTHSYETKGPNKGQKMDLMAWPYDSMTIQDFDNYYDMPTTLSGIPGLAGYIWTDNGLHIYQNGKHELLDDADPTYEFVSQYNRGWYGDRLRSKDDQETRTLVTSDESMARAWAKAGGLVRLVKDVVRSFGVSRKRRDF